MHDGVPPVNEYAVPVTNGETARAAVESSVKNGFDFVKVYDRIPRQAYFALAEECNRRSIPFAGHVPELITVAEASDAGQRSIEHPRDLLMAAIPGACELWGDLARARADHDSESEAYQSVFQRLKGTTVMGDVDPSLLQPALRRMVSNGTWLTPTLTVVRGELCPGELKTDPRLRYVPADVVADWRMNPRIPPEQEAQIGQQVLRK
jgi:hypothetical protein